MTKFPWGQIIEVINIPFSTENMGVVKYHPYDLSVPGNKVNYDKVAYSCPAMGRSADTLESLVLHWFAYINLGRNEGSLVQGIERALGMKVSE
jgi:hypothetical protein